MKIRVGILTVSDRSAHGERSDLSGPALRQAVLVQGWEVVEQAILPDARSQLENWLKKAADSNQMDILLTTGGTGFARRDVTPEATVAVVEKLTPGLPEAMRAASLKEKPHAMLSRATAGIRGSTLIVNLPGNPEAAVENLAVIMTALPHAVQLLREDPDSEAAH
jgi:molybdopterin adenylyltransferase